MQKGGTVLELIKRPACGAGREIGGYAVKRADGDGGSKVSKTGACGGICVGAVYLDYTRRGFE